MTHVTPWSPPYQDPCVPPYQDPDHPHVKCPLSPKPQGGQTNNLEKRRVVGAGISQGLLPGYPDPITWPLKKADSPEAGEMKETQTVDEMGLAPWEKKVWDCVEHSNCQEMDPRDHPIGPSPAWQWDRSCDHVHKGAPVSCKTCTICSPNMIGKWDIALEDEFLSCPSFGSRGRVWEMRRLQKWRTQEDQRRGLSPWRGRRETPPFSLAPPVCPCRSSLGAPTFPSPPPLWRGGGGVPPLRRGGSLALGARGFALRGRRAFARRR